MSSNTPKEKPALKTADAIAIFTVTDQQSVPQIEVTGAGTNTLRVAISPKAEGLLLEKSVEILKAILAAGSKSAPTNNVNVDVRVEASGAGTK